MFRQDVDDFSPGSEVEDAELNYQKMSSHAQIRPQGAEKQLS